MIGAIPPRLGDLTYLSRLSLSENRLSGRIPPELGRLKRLTSLWLDENHLSGEIPRELGELTRLFALSLPRNRLSGEIPPELGRLTRLVTLRLHSNQLSGAIPRELGELKRLGWLWLAWNRLGGEIPPELGELVQLAELALHENQLSGAIPAELGKLARLSLLSLYQNQLTGAIPPELGKLTQLTQLVLHTNQLCREIPPELGTLTQLSVLALDTNQLTGAIPPELGKLTQLTELVLHTNQLCREIPPELGTLTQLSVLALDTNQLTGAIPPELGKLTQLTQLVLHTNQLCREIPPELGTLTQLSALALYQNQLTGAIPPELGKLERLTQLLLHTNQLCREIPPELGTLTQLSVLDLSKNQLTGAIPRELGNLERLTRLLLHANQLSGGIPPELGTLTQLSVLGLYQNQLYGEIPRELGNLTHLTELVLHTNQLCGEIPRELSDLDRLTTLALYTNRLSGEIPSRLGAFSSLTILVLHENQLRGAIPRELGDLTQLSMLGLHENQLSGAIPHELGNLERLSMLGLHENQLSGAIPSELANLEQLNHVTLGGNQNLQGGRADLFDLDVTGLGTAVFAKLIEPSPAPTSTAALAVAESEADATEDDEPPGDALESATFHIFSLHPIELYDGEIATRVADMFPRLVPDHKCEDTWHECDRIPFDLKLLTELDMNPVRTFSGKRRTIGRQSVNEYAMLIGTVLCIVYHATHGIETSYPEDTRLHARMKWAVGIAETPPQWILDALPYNSMGALYRAAWIWMYQRYIWSQWMPDSAGNGAVKQPTAGSSIRDFADGNEKMIEERLFGELVSSRRLTRVVEMVAHDHPRIFTFSALEIKALWQEHFSTTAYALDILNALDDGVHLSLDALEKFEDGVYRRLEQTHIYLRDLMSGGALKNPTESLIGEGFQEVTKPLVDALSKLDLARVRKRLVEYQPLRSDEDEGVVKSDWLDVQDGDKHLFVQAGPDLATITTANPGHIDEIVAMEIALQSGWNSFARASGRVLEAHEPEKLEPSSEPSPTPGEQQPRVKGWRAKISASGRALIDWLHPGDDDDLAASDEEDALLDAMSDQLLRVTRWRAQVSGWRRVVFEQLRQASGLDDNIDAFYRASEESVKRSEVLREKVRAQQERKFQAAVALAALALAAVVLGEIAISIQDSGNVNNAVPRAAAWIVGIGLVVIAWFIAKSLSNQPSKLSRGVGWFWDRMSESIAALLLVGLMAAFLHENLGGGPPEAAQEWLGRSIASLAAAIVLGLAWRVLRERWPEVLTGLLAGFAALVWAPDDFLGGSPFWIVDWPLWTVWTGVVALAGGVSLALLIGWPIRWVRTRV